MLRWSPFQEVAGRADHTAMAASPERPASAAALNKKFSLRTIGVSVVRPTHFSVGDLSYVTPGQRRGSPKSQPAVMTRGKVGARLWPSEADKRPPRLRIR